MGEGPLVRCEATKHHTNNQETLVSHRNAPLTPEGRHRLCLRVDSGRAISHVAAEAGIARQTLGKCTPGGRPTASTGCKTARPGR